MLEYGLSPAKNVKSSWRFVVSSTGHVWGSASPHLDLVWLLITVSHSLSAADTPSLLHSNVILLAGCWHWHWISNVFVDILYYCLNHIWCLSCPTRTLWYLPHCKVQSQSIVMSFAPVESVQFSSQLCWLWCWLRLQPSCKEQWEESLCFCGWTQLHLPPSHCGGPVVGWVKAAPPCL